MEWNSLNYPINKDYKHNSCKMSVGNFNVVLEEVDGSLLVKVKSKEGKQVFNLSNESEGRLIVSCLDKELTKKDLDLLIESYDKL